MLNHNVLYFINGQESSKETVELIDPAKIQSIDVLKVKSAEKKCGEKGKNGVIELTIPITSNSKFIEKAQPLPGIAEMFAKVKGGNANICRAWLHISTYHNSTFPYLCRLKKNY